MIKLLQKKSWLIFAIVCLGFLMNPAIASRKLSEKDLVAATLFPEPRPVKAFTLTDSNNQPFTEKNLQGHWTLIFFGFTNCPMICPTALSTLNQAYTKLVDTKQDPLPEVLFISVDPERDTLKRIGTYVAGFNPKFIGATGTKQQLDSLTAQLSVLYMKVMPENGKNKKDYNIDHSGTILVINPAGALHAIFSMPHDADKIAKDFQKISAAY